MMSYLINQEEEEEQGYNKLKSVLSKVYFRQA